MPKTKFKKFILIAGLFLLFSFFFINITQAARGIEINYPEIGGIKPTGDTTIPEYVKYIFNFSLIVSGVLLFGIILFAGFKLLISRGSANAQKDAKDRIWNAILGILLLFGSYIILTQINPQLLEIKPVALQKCDCNIPRDDLSDYCKLACVPPEFAPEKNIITAQEIPLGKLVQNVLDTSLFESMKSSSQRVRDLAEEIKSLAQDYQRLTAACSCSNSSPSVPTCEYGAGCGAEPCLNDPCRNRDEIDTTRAIILAKSIQLQTLLDKTKERDGESGFLELTEKIRTNYNNLLTAEDVIGNCQNTGRTLMGYNDFWDFKESAEREKLADKVEIDKKPWQSITGGSSTVTFYCVDQGFDFSGSAPDIDTDLSGIDIPDQLGSYNTYCGSEIPVGEATDRAENLVARIVTEIQSVIDNSKTIIASGNSLGSTSCRGVEACNTGCIENSRPQPDTYECGLGGLCSTDADCEEGDTCQPVSHDPINTCSVIPCFSYGSLCSSSISSLVSSILSSFSGINGSNDILKDFLSTRDEGQRNQILQQLTNARTSLNACFNSASTWAKVQRGESAVTKDLRGCKFILESGGGEFFYYKKTTGEKIEDCYGKDPGTLNLMENYFCCESETGF